MWPRAAVIVLVVGALGLPINDLFRYALLLIAVAIVFTGAVSLRPGAWLGAVAIVSLAVLAQFVLAAPRIEEGHNVFLPGEQGRALEAGLPAEVYRFMAARFHAQYPPESRCSTASGGCWRSQPGPDRVFAFSGDGLLDRPAYSRRVTDIDFSDPVWLRLGFINGSRYNWYSGASDVQRNARERRFWMVLHPWRLTMPFFVMYRFPADFAGSRLCWRGEVMWEGADQRFSLWRHPEMVCRTIEADDIGRRIFGVSIAKDAPLAMKLAPSWTIQLRQLLEPAVALVAIVSILALLVTWSRRRVVLPIA